jgi:excisionase family DNA binding protein
MTTPHSTSYLLELEAAEYLRRSSRSLQRMRQDGTGPRFYRTGGRILYTAEDLDAWVRANARMSTSETGSAS